MFADLNAGFGYLRAGFADLKRPEYRRYLIAPIALNLALLVGVFWGLSGVYTGVAEQASAALPGWLSWLEWLIEWVLGALTLVIMVYLFATLTTLIGAPFYGLLAERAELALGGTPAPNANTRDWLLLVPRALSREVRKLGYWLPRGLLLLLLGWIPLVNVAAPLLWLLFGAWVLAIEFCDYPGDNHRVPFPEVLGRLRQHRAAACGFGLPLFFALGVPVLNLFAVPAAVLGGTHFWIARLTGEPPRTITAG